jgi:hypothetical protein
VISACLCLAAALVGSGCARPQDPRSTAVRIADRVMDRLGGKDRWDSQVGLCWTFEVAAGDTLRPGARRHAWDKHSGWHRVEGRNARGQSYVIVHNLHSGEGRAWVDGAAIEGDSLQKLLKRAKSLWTNDTYWLLMPYKLQDEGVRLVHEGTVEEQGAIYHRLALSFDDVGETPGDRYWVHVNRANDRIERWEYVLQGGAPPAQTATWEGWELHGGLWFPTIHRSGDRTIYTRNVEVVSAFPPSTFSAP